MKPNKPKHTPGPWTVGATVGLKETIMSPQGGMVAKVLTKGTLNNYANAHLIAASPCIFDKLSVALERLKEKNDGSNRDLGLIQSIEKTLAKSRGEL